MNSYNQHPGSAMSVMCCVCVCGGGGVPVCHMIPSHV